MTRFAFIYGVLFSLYLISYQCEGGITSPPDGTEYIFLPGQTAKIKWKFNDAISSLKLRLWAFTSSDGSLKNEVLATIFKNESTEIETKLLEVDIERPATLVLKNVNQSYAGVYRFSLTTSTGFTSDVGVFIAKMSTAIVSCPSRNEVNEGDDFTCECSSKGGIPPNNATWFKNGVQFGETKKEKKILNLTDVDETDNGTYTCVAESYPSEVFKDKKSIVLKINSKPNNTSIRFIPDPVKVGNPVKIRCVSDGVPEPSFIIMRNGINVTTEKTYTISEVEQSDEGPYTCSAVNALGNDSATDNLTVIDAPLVTFSCPSPTIVNEGDNFTCACRSQGGNPPANVTWYKDGVQMGETGMKEQILTLSNIDKTDSGKYKCVAQSHTLTDERSIEIIVYCAIPPVVVSLRSTPENVVFGESVVIMCEAIAVPLPSYTIIHNDTKIVSTHKTYIITVLKQSHAGLYKCIATNHLGNSSKTFSFSVAGKFKAALEESNRNGTEWYIIVVSLVSGIIIGIFLSYIVSCSRRKFSSRNPQSNPERPATEVDTTYQELDLTKMNAEDNYQSLRVNAARIDAGNDNDSTYTELNKTRDVENNYQSLS